MSYDIEMINKNTEEILLLKNPQYIWGGTYAVDSNMRPILQTEARLNITYNYSKYFYEATENDSRFAHKDYEDKIEYGIRGIYGKTPEQSIPMLKDMIDRINYKYKNENGDWIKGVREKRVVFDKDGNELGDWSDIFCSKYKDKIAYDKIVEYTISEGDTDNYWEETAANAINSLYKLLYIATDCICEENAIWSGD